MALRKVASGPEAERDLQNLPVLSRLQFVSYAKDKNETLQHFSIRHA
jgi:hypothetical protein